MLELTDAQKQEDINDRIEKFKVELQALSKNFHVQLEPVVQASPRGIIPMLAISDLKYKVEKSILDIPDKDLNREARRLKKKLQ